MELGKVASNAGAQNDLTRRVFLMERQQATMIANDEHVRDRARQDHQNCHDWGRRNK